MGINKTTHPYTKFITNDLYRLMVSENRVLKRIFRPNLEKVTGC